MSRGGVIQYILVIPLISLLINPQMAHACVLNNAEQVCRVWRAVHCVNPHREHKVLETNAHPVHRSCDVGVKDLAPAVSMYWMSSFNDILRGKAFSGRIKLEFN